MTGPSVLWFRHGLRLHDNPALLNAIELANGGQFMAVFIFDGETAGTKLVGYNRMKFLLESLADLDYQLRNVGSQLFIFKGSPTLTFRRLWEELGINSISVEQDCEPIWRERDSAVEKLCRELDIGFYEKISHTLWNPRTIIEKNGGVAPLTYQMFLHTVSCLGPPERPVSDPDFTSVSFVKLPSCVSESLGIANRIPVPEDFEISREATAGVAHLQWHGGETQALDNLKRRLIVEANAFQRGDYLPNYQMTSDLLGSPTSLSPHLRFGCLSARRFYHTIHDQFAKVQGSYGTPTPSPMVGGPHLTGQLFWREYFYTMCVDNPLYDRIEGNPICLNIPWAKKDEVQFEKWKTGRTGFPLIDAAIRQLIAEGWLHHTLRNAIASFLTRGGLWYSWEHGLQFFLKYLLDADWSVCAGNWLWISSSAFEKLLDSSKCTCPVALARRLDPMGEYILRYIPELRKLPEKYVHQPWQTPIAIQQEVGCIIGEHYPQPMIDLAKAGEDNAKAMQKIRHSVLEESALNKGNSALLPAHCRPSSDDEIRTFFWLNEDSVAPHAVSPVKAN